MSSREERTQEVQGEVGRPQLEQWRCLGPHADHPLCHHNLPVSLDGLNEPHPTPETAQITLLLKKKKSSFPQLEARGKKKKKNWGQREAAVFQPSFGNRSALTLWVFSLHTLNRRRFPLVGQALCCSPSRPAIKGQRFRCDPRALPAWSAASRRCCFQPPRLWLALLSRLLFCLSPPLWRLQGLRPESLQECSCLPYFFFFPSLSLSLGLM